MPLSQEKPVCALMRDKKTGTWERTQVPVTRFSHDLFYYFPIIRFFAANLSRRRCCRPFTLAFWTPEAHKGSSLPPLSAFLPYSETFSIFSMAQVATSPETGPSTAVSGDAELALVCSAFPELMHSMGSEATLTFTLAQARNYRQQVHELISRCTTSIEFKTGGGTSRFSFFRDALSRFGARNAVWLSQPSDQMALLAVASTQLPPSGVKAEKRSRARDPGGLRPSWPPEVICGPNASPFLCLSLELY